MWNFFKNVVLKEIIILSGDAHIKFKKRQDGNITIYSSGLMGDYHLIYKSIDFVIKNNHISINNEDMYKSSVLIENDGKINWGNE
jgi:hypothetical protein